MGAVAVGIVTTLLVQKNDKIVLIHHQENLEEVETESLYIETVKRISTA